jgi:hypothetical protein
MNDKQKECVMVATAQSLIDMIQRRLANRVAALSAIAASPLDNLPNDIRTMREIESAKIRSVMEEQSDLIEIIKMLYPTDGGKEN